MHNKILPFYSLHSELNSLWIDCRDNAPAILYWGQGLGSHTTPEMLAALNTRQEAKACPQREVPIALSPEFASGFIGNAGIQVYRGGQDWAVYAQLSAVEFDQASNSLCFVSRCDNSQLEIEQRLSLDPQSNVIAAICKITNRGPSALTVEQCNAPTFPLPLECSQIIGFEGRWAKEFQRHSVARHFGTYLRENRAGRTSHDSFPAVIVHTRDANEESGAAYGFHLGWSGNHRIRVEEQSSGLAYAQLGELFYPGELAIEEGQSYQSPTLYAAHSAAGFNQLSQNFHCHVRTHLRDPRMTGKTKPVHFNTWEAMYFDLDLAKLCDLADLAASVGVERFVLDDGWFNKRNADNAALGDWFVDREVFPDGLTPLIEHVHQAGMEFGLWIEPEMVNPDSDLYRAHPDWVLGAQPAPMAIARNQLPLDLTRPEVCEYLFARIDALLTEYPIAYLKWDMNRDLSQPGGHSGKVVTHHQTLALYALLERVRSKHPMLQIESCSSGGARADYGILKYTDRVWTSDSNDAIDRLSIQKGFSYFFPADLMGAHVGPYDCHITERKIAMATRVAVAMMGDMGIEANLLELSKQELTELAAGVALHKQHRELILYGERRRLDLNEYEDGVLVTSTDQRHALLSYALLDSHPHSLAGKIYLAGLDPTALYQIKLIWPQSPYHYSHCSLDEIDGKSFSGQALMQNGIQVPLMMPQSVLIFHLEAIA